MYHGTLLLSFHPLLFYEDGHGKRGIWRSSVTDDGLSFLLPPSPKSYCPCANLKIWVVKKSSTKILARINYKIVLEKETVSFTDVNLQGQNVYSLDFLGGFTFFSSLQNSNILNCLQHYFFYLVFFKEHFLLSHKVIFTYISVMLKIWGTDTTSFALEETQILATSLFPGCIECLCVLDFCMLKHFCKWDRPQCGLTYKFLMIIFAPLIILTGRMLTEQFENNLSSEACISFLSLLRQIMLINYTGITHSWIPWRAL